MARRLLLVALLAVGAPAAAQPAAGPPSTSPPVGGAAASAGDVSAAAAAGSQANAGVRTEYHVRFVQQDTVYLDGGYDAGLAAGMKLLVRDRPSGGAATAGSTPIAELIIVGVAQTSAVAEVHDATRPLVAGDAAYLSTEDVDAVVNAHAVGPSRSYPVVITFDEGGDALDAEAHAAVPRPPLPSTNRARGRFGFDYLGSRTLDGRAFDARNVGFMFQGNFTRINGSDWTLSGYWRGRLTTTSSETQPTLQDLINRTYHLSLTHDNGSTGWVAGVGRLYLPWASSLETLDGGYVGSHLTKTITAGLFGGSSPDPTSYSYNPNLERLGGFMNAQGGSFARLRLSSTVGGGTDLLSWHLDRPFVFTENSVSAGPQFSIFHAMQLDSPAGNTAVDAPGTGVGRSFLTLHWTPAARLQLDANHTYFRDVPMFDARLIGTGLLDKYLFQGVSGGARVEVIRGTSAYVQLGRSSRTGDSDPAWNRMYGITVSLPDIGRVDVHRSVFSSAFGEGTYLAASATRTFHQAYRIDLLAGQQHFVSPAAGDQSARFATVTLDATVRGGVFLNGGLTLYRGEQQNYNQWMFTCGYRFDMRGRE